MKKSVFIFLLAILLPSVLLSVFAYRSVKAQKIILKQQQQVVAESIADKLVLLIQTYLDAIRLHFVTKIDGYLGTIELQVFLSEYDKRLKTRWHLVDLGFVTSQNQLLIPQSKSHLKALSFQRNYESFLTNETFLSIAQQTEYTTEPRIQKQLAKMSPQETSQGENSFEKLAKDQDNGYITRFVDNGLDLLLWCKSEKAPDHIFGIKINLEALKKDIAEVFATENGEELPPHLCFALLDHSGEVIIKSDSHVEIEGKKPLISREISQKLPYWRIATYPTNLTDLASAATNLQWILGFFILLLLFTIGTGCLLIFKDMNRQIELARQKTDFVSNVSHELKTPLTSIQLFSELLEREQTIKNKEKCKKFSGIIKSEVMRLSRLINNVLDFSKMEKGSKEYQLETINSTCLVNEVFENYRGYLESSGFHCHFHAEQEVILVRADRDALSQVLINLLSNARNYSENIKQIEVILKKNEAGDKMVLSVLDRGKGVPQGEEEKIFEKFYRADKALSSETSGTGLGLSIAKAIVEAHHGSLFYRPREGGGSIFVVELPLVKNHEEKNSHC